MVDRPTAEEALKRLEPLLGKWRLEATPPDGEPWPGEAHVSFEWHESGAHLITRTTRTPTTAVSAASIR